MSDLRTRMIALGCAALGFAAPAVAQDGRAFPPVPGPFLIAPDWAQPSFAPQAAPPAPAAVQPPRGATFAAPANAMRVPYWMQPDPQRAQPQTMPAAGADQMAGNAVPAAPQGNAGYGRAAAPGTFPSYGATIPWAGPGQPPAGPMPPGYGANAPDWGTAPQPGWRPAPFVPGAGWGGWSQPTTGGGN